METQRTLAEIQTAIKDRLDQIWWFWFNLLESYGRINYKQEYIDRDIARAERIEKRYKELHEYPITVGVNSPEKSWGEINALMWILEKEWGALEHGCLNDIANFYFMRPGPELENGFTWFDEFENHIAVQFIDPIIDMFTKRTN